jgi:phage shock protein A
MAYFSRLTDIVQCNLTRLLEESDDPGATLVEIISEMEAGLAGAQRSMKTAAGNQDAIRIELEGQDGQITRWSEQARSELAAGNEDQARLSLIRKKEVEDLTAGLQEQLKAAEQTREHLSTTYRALEARLADARRRNQMLAAGGDWREEEKNVTAEARPEISRSAEIEEELAELKRQLGQAD